MNDSGKSEGRPTADLIKLRQRITELEASERRLTQCLEELRTEHRQTEQALRRSEEIKNSDQFKELKKAAEEAVANAEPTPEQLAQTAVAKALIEDAVQNVSDEAAKIINAPSEPTGEDFRPFVSFCGMLLA